MGDGRGENHEADGEASQARRAYLYAEDLARVTPWSVDAIEKMVARGKLRRGIHWFQPAGRRIFKWAAIVKLIEGDVLEKMLAAAPAKVSARRKVLSNVEEATERLRRLLD